jgi:uncharacterized tellurite resistance protein B-like protein
MVINQSFPDFVLFLYVHMAMADGGIHVTEENVILEKMSKLYPPEKDKKQLLAESIARYKSIEPESILPSIRETFQHFSQVKFPVKYKVYTDMYDIINADGVVDEAETQALESLKKIINVSAGTN